MVATQRQNSSDGSLDPARRMAGPTRVVVIGPTEFALQIASEHPEAIVEVYERNWSEVDRGRELAAAQGLHGRVAVRPMIATVFTCVEGCRSQGAAA